MMTQEGAAVETKSPEFMTTALSGYELLADPQLNKATAFPDTERLHPSSCFGRFGTSWAIG